MNESQINYFTEQLMRMFMEEGNRVYDHKGNTYDEAKIKEPETFKEFTEIFRGMVKKGATIREGEPDNE